MTVENNSLIIKSNFSCDIFVHLIFYGLSIFLYLTFVIQLQSSLLNIIPRYIVVLVVVVISYVFTKFALQIYKAFVRQFKFILLLVVLFGLETALVFEWAGILPLVLDTIIPLLLLISFTMGIMRFHMPLILSIKHLHTVSVFRNKIQFTHIITKKTSEFEFSAIDGFKECIYQSSIQKIFGRICQEARKEEKVILLVKDEVEVFRFYTLLYLRVEDLVSEMRSPYLGKEKLLPINYL